MNLSYWEIKSWLSHVDFTIVGSGIVGLSCALELKERFPKANILVIEKGRLPQGASTKNAGFACFGSLSEILDDLKDHSRAEVFNLVKKRIEGLRLLRKTLGDKAIDYKNLGGYELFFEKDDLLYRCLSELERINTLLNPLFEADIYSVKDNSFGFKGVKSSCIFNRFEGQIDTGKMMDTLLSKVQTKGVKILNNVEVETFSENQDVIQIKTNVFELNTSNLLIATNGFASQLIRETVTPARAQVLITKPIKDLPIKGTFHLDRGYYYFRNINDRILFGGGRHLDFEAEKTTKLAQTDLIQSKLKSLLRSTILPDTEYEIDHSWSGIMGVGQTKQPIVKQLSSRVFCGVKLGGMGVAIGSLVGKDLADLL